jgi:hypothetical protein
MIMIESAKVMINSSWIKNRWLILLMVLWSLFPTLRVLILGVDSSKNVLELMFSNIPELFFIFIVYLYKDDIIRNITSNKKNKLGFIIYIIIVLSGIVVGYIENGGQILPIIYGYKLTYLPLLVLFFPLNNSEIIKDNMDKIFSYFVYYTILSLVFHFLFNDFEKKVIIESGHLVPEYFIMRTGGFLLTPVPFSIIVSFSIIYFFVKLISEKQQVLHWLYLIILFLGLNYSVSRIGLLGVQIIIIYVSLRTKNIFIFKGILVLMLFYLVSIIVFNEHKKFFSWLFFSTKQTVSLNKNVKRSNLWISTFNELKENYLLGYGIGSAGAGAIKFFKDNPQKASINSTDCWYLKIFNELGIINALLLFVFIFLMIFKDLFKEDFVFSSSIFLLVFISAIFNNILDFFPLNVLIYFILKNPINYKML